MELTTIHGLYWMIWGVPFVEKHQSLETSSKILSFLVTFYLWCSGALFPWLTSTQARTISHQTFVAHDVLGGWGGVKRGDSVS